MKLPVEILPWLADDWAFFMQRLEQGRLPHALMLEGPAGTGKLRLAQAMQARLLCNAQQAQACGECRSCRMLRGGAHPDRFDLTPIDDSAVIKVDQVRELIAALNLTTSASARKVACIHPAENLNEAAANALLKSLEEPNGDAVLILVSSNPGQIPVTIRSRCHCVRIRIPDRPGSTNWLLEVCSKPREEIVLALAAAGGSPLRAQQYLESPALSGYTQIHTALAMLLSRPAAVSMVCGQLLELDPESLWRWLSMCASEAVKSKASGQPLNWLPKMTQLQLSPLLVLQKRADINRQLSQTPLRKDLMLQEWLIDWALQAH